MATSDEYDVFPHAEKTVIRVRKVKEQATGPSFVWLDNVIGVHAEIVTSESIDFQNKEALMQFTDFLCETTLAVAARRFIIRDPEVWMKKVAGEERGLARATLLGNVVGIGRNLSVVMPRFGWPTGRMAMTSTTAVCVTALGGQVTLMGIGADEAW